MRGQCGHDRLASDDGGRLADRSPSRVLDELRGIADGANARRGPDGEGRWISIDDLLAWNGYPEMICQWFPAVQGGLKPAAPLPSQLPAPGPAPAVVPALAARYRFRRHHCSAFVATGEWTADHGIVAAHTTWQRFANGDAYNVILSLVPQRGEGSAILMQTAPGYVASSMDFGQNAAGVVAISTSIDADGFNPEGLPYFLRARRAGQYAHDIDDWVALFRDGNNSGYINTWLLAEARSGRIAAYELTARHAEKQPTLTSGAYASCNVPLSTVIRVQAAAGAHYDNILHSGAARRVRFGQLLPAHQGRIDAAIAQAILSDHCDVYAGPGPSGRTICGHCDADDDRYNTGHGPHYPWGSLDGKVTTGALVGRKALLARWGRACGTPFAAKAFFDTHPQYADMRDLTRDRPSRDWAEFGRLRT
jgi:Phospholipase B